MSKTSHNRQLLALLALILAFQAGCDSFATDKSRFLSPDKTIKSPTRSPVNPILPSRSAADPNSEILPHSSLPGPEDWTYSDRDYIIGPTDVLDISILDLYAEGQETTLRREVSSTGYIDLPQLPSRIRAEGLTKEQLREEIQKAYSPKIIRDPSVSVTVAAARQNTFSILGAIGRPGAYPVMRRDMRLLDALALAGDITQTNIQYLYVIRQAPPLRKSEPQPAGTGGAKDPPPALKDLPPLPDLPDEPALGSPATAPAAGPTTLPAEPRPAAPVDQPPVTVVQPAPPPPPVSGVEPAAASQPAQTVEVVVRQVPAQPDVAAAPAAASPPAQTADASARLARWVFRNGKWIEEEPAPPKPTAPKLAASQPVSQPVVAAAPPPKPKPAEPIVAPLKPTIPLTGNPNDPFGWLADEGSKPSRLIAISVEKLKAGDPRMNIVIRDNDIIQVPMLQVGEFYVMGEVSRPGVYSLTGRNVTVKQALAAAGNLGPLAWPKNSILVRRIAPHQEQTIPLDLEAICRGEQPDIFLKPDDVLAVGSDVRAPFLAVLRNAFRMTYGFGFIYDRNFADPLVGAATSARFTRL